MKKIIFFLIMLVFFVRPLKAEAIDVAASSASLRNGVVLKEEFDERFLLLASYLKGKSSPLTDYSHDFIKAADYWSLDWRLMPAIAGLESSFGKRLVAGSHNPFGWGGGYIYFSSWEEAINQVGQSLREKYYDRGKDTPLKIGPVYAPPNPQWGVLVKHLMEEISPLR